MQHVNCNVCGADEATLLNEGRDLLLNRPGRYRLVRCRQCGTIYQNPQLTRAELSACYPDDYLLYTTGDPEHKSRLQALADDHAQARRRMRITRHANRPGAILDIGCATGQFLAHMRDHGWQATGVEISAYAADFARSEFDLNVHTGTLEEAALPDGAFDVITLWDVFEHVNDPRATLAEIRRLLRPGGLLVISLPNPASLEAKLFGAYWVGWERPRHLHLFPPAVLTRLLAETGYSLAGIESFSGRLSVTLLSVEFWLKGRGWTAARWAPWRRRLYNWPLRLATWPFYKLLERLNRTTGMTLFARRT